MEKIISKIKKLLEMTLENGASENEAMVAALKAQKLMAEYNLTVADIDTDDTHQSIIKEQVNCGTGDKWKYTLAGIIARNFCCKHYSIGKNKIIFYGYEKDAKIAADVFKFLFNTGNKLADRCYYEYYKNGENTRGVKNTYLIGFCEGINEVLGKQCTALMIVTPKEVTESFDEMTKSMKKLNSTINCKYGTKAYKKGKTDGISTANARSIES